jgi:hypothetical protein
MTLTPGFKPADEADWPEAYEVVKALAMAEFPHIVDDGGAAIIAVQSGTLEPCLATGEIFLLGKATVARLA